MPIYKTKLDVLDKGNIRGSCSCGWKGNLFAQSSGISAAMSAAQSEIQAHEHIPPVPKPRKNSKKAPPITGVI